MSSYYLSDIEELLPFLFLEGYFVFVIIAAIFALVFAVAFYIATALPLYGIARQRGYEHAWLAWIPVGQQFIFGWIGDDIQRQQSGTCWNLKWWLLGLDGLTILLTVIPYIGIPLLSLAGIAISVLSYIALYRILEEYLPDSKVMWLVLSIFFSIAQIICLFMAMSRAKKRNVSPFIQ